MIGSHSANRSEALSPLVWVGSEPDKFLAVWVKVSANPVTRQVMVLCCLWYPIVLSSGRMPGLSAMTLAWGYPASRLTA